MHAQAGYLSYMNVKPLEIPKFNGKQRNYLQWRQCFQQVINMDTRTTENYKLAQLRAALAGGEAEELVAGVIDGPGAYAAVLAELESWYGGPMEEVAYLEQELMAWPKISSKRNWEALKVFAFKPGTRSLTCMYATSDQAESCTSLLLKEYPVAS